jgi:hypothetical protein
MGSSDNRDIGFDMRFTQHQPNPSMGIKPACELFFVETFYDKYHPLLLPAFMLVKVDKALFFELVLHTMGAIVNRLEK